MHWERFSQPGEFEELPPEANEIIGWIDDNDVPSDYISEATEVDLFTYEQALATEAVAEMIATREVVQAPLLPPTASEPTEATFPSRFHRRYAYGERPEALREIVRTLAEQGIDARDFIEGEKMLTVYDLVVKPGTTNADIARKVHKTPNRASTDVGNILDRILHRAPLGSIPIEAGEPTGKPKAELPQGIGADVNALRAAKGLTYKEVAERAGLSVSSVATFFGCTSYPPIETVARILEALEMERVEGNMLLYDYIPERYAHLRRRTKSL
ncbi:MAG TPA: helix-turn-helix transcriptional regulator [Candidatus Saccharimonadales bacterium]|nr:helix-turn-helix transcriptional regulator [Candidatus Saccharimonadales bacterium]